jgi:superfamily II DNA helicase RecQ
MVDQVLSVRRRGVDAAAIITSGGGVSKDCWLPMTIIMGKCSFLFGAPEALVGSKWREAVEKPVISERIVAIVVEEAHFVKMVSCAYIHACEGTYIQTSTFSSSVIL